MHISNFQIFTIGMFKDLNRWLQLLLYLAFTPQLHHFQLQSPSTRAAPSVRQGQLRFAAQHVAPPQDLPDR